jgi:ADP-heptose:LPS heptosyltransferase
MQENTQPVKYLIVRFSSIGDIVLTTPVIRGLKQQVENAEIYYLTKPAFKGIVENNPHVDKVLTLKDKLKDTVKEIQDIAPDYIIDLHNNLRTSLIKRKVRVLAFAFNKLNFKKWLLVNLKINKMPHKHIVDRYLETTTLFDVQPDNQGLDYFIPEKDEVVTKDLHAAFEGKFLAVVLGANHATKQIPNEKLVSIINGAGVPVCLLGGKDVEAASEQVANSLKVPFLNTVGKLNLNQSASVVKQSAIVLTPDTGLMHIAAAFKKTIFSFWGNTVPEFGMYPYLSAENSTIFEVNDLRCRPCSKIGHSKCPKGHFKCMKQIDEKSVVEKITAIVREA